MRSSFCSGSGGALCLRFRFLFRRGDSPLDARADDARIAAHHQD